MVELKSSIPIGAITEISPKGSTIGVKVEKNKINLPFYGPNLAPRQKKDTYKLRRPICNPWGQCGCNKYCCFDEIYFEDLNKP